MSWTNKLNRNRRWRSRRGGLMAIYPVMLVALTAFATLAIDFGHLQVVRDQLHAAGDAAAIAAAEQLVYGTSNAQLASAVTAAVNVAAQNYSDGAAIPLQAADVQVGNWDTTQTPNFSATRLPVNAAAVSISRDAAHGNPMQVTWGSLLGVTSCNVSNASVAAIPTQTSTYGIVGINHVNFSSVGVLAQIQGDVASNGNISIGSPLGLLVGVTGDARSYGGSVTHGSLASIAGSTTALSSALSYPSVTVPTNNNNAQISTYINATSDFNATLTATIPAGTYVVHDLNFLAGLSVNLQGPVTFYVTGAFNMAVGINLLGSPNTSASNFNVKVAKGGTVNFLANLLTPQYMNVYAPDSAITISVGINHYSGSLIGNTLDVNLPILGQFTEQKLTNSTAIMLVQ